MKRFLACILALLLLLTGCSRPEAPAVAAPAEDPVAAEPAPTPEEPAPTAFHLAAEALPLPGELGNVTAQCTLGNLVLSGGQGPDGPLLLSSGPDGSDVQVLELPPETDFLYALTPEDSGFTLLCGSFPANYLDGSNRQQHLDAPENRLFLCRYDGLGHLQGGITLKETYDSSQCIFKQLLPTPEGYVLLSRYHLIALDPTGQELAAAELEVGGSLSFTSMVLQESELTVLCREPFSEDSILLQRRSAATLEVLEEQTVERPLVGLGQQADGSLLLIDSDPQSGLLGEDLTPVCLWQILGAPLSGRQVFPLSGGYLFYDDYETALSLLRKVSGPQPEPVVLTMASTGMGPFAALVRGFNLSQTDYRIDLTDFGLDYGTGDAVTPDLLRTRILAGEVPDLYGFASASSTMPPERAGLSPEALCAELSEEVQLTLVPQVLALLTQAGSLHTLPLSFSISTCQAPAALFSQRGVSLADLEAVRASVGDDYLPTPGWMTAINFFGMGLSFYAGRCIDETQGVCSFDTKEFRDFLTFCKTWTGDGQNLEQGQPALLNFAFLCNLEFLLTYPEAEGPDRRSTFVGFPVTDGVGHQLHITSELGISNQCSSPDGAEAFVRYCLDHNTRENGRFDLPANRDQLEAEIDRLREGSTDFTGEALIFDEERLALFRNILDETTVLANQDGILQNLLCQEAAAYFSGQNSLDRTIELIRNRAALYLAEQK